MLTLSFCGGGGVVCTVIFVSIPIAVLRLSLAWGWDNLSMDGSNRDFPFRIIKHRCINLIESQMKRG